MDINFEQAFSFVKDDPHWGRKIAIGGGLSAIAILVLCIPFMILPFTTSVPFYVAMLATCSVFAVAIMFALAGYPFMVIHNRINNQEEILPSWSEFFRIVFAGIKTSIGHFLFILPALFFSVIILLMFLGAFSLGTSILAMLITFLGFVMVFALTGIVTLYSLFYPLMSGVFSENMNVFSYVNFKRGWELLKGNWLNYLILMLLLIAVGVIFHFAAMLLVLTIAGVILIPWICFYASLVCADLVAQFVKTESK